MKLLVVDDDEGIRTLLRLTFRDAAVELYEASGGDDALDIAAAEQPNIVICDGTMPFTQGGEVGQGVRALVPDAIIVSFSGSDRNKPWADLSIMKGTPGDLQRLRDAVYRAIPPRLS